MAQFPIANFDWLGELPGLANEASDRRKRQDVFANLDTSDPDSLRKAANRLMSSGSIKDLELGLRLHATAQARENLTQKGQADQLLMDYWKTKGLNPFANPAPTDQPMPALPPDPVGGASDPFGPRPNMQVPPDVQSLPPRAELGPAAAPSSPVQMAALGGGGLPPMREPPPPVSPSEQILAAAEGPPTQLAQALPPSQTMIDAARVPPAPPQGAPQPTAAVPDPGPRASARERARYYGYQLSLIPPIKGAQNMQQVRALQQAHQNALIESRLGEKEVLYEQDKVDRQRHNLPPITMTEFLHQQAAGKEHDTTAGQHYLKTYKAEEAKADELQRVIAPIGRLLENPKLILGGTASPAYLAMKQNVVGLVNIAKELGIDVERAFPGIKDIKDSAALQENFLALANQAIYAKIGSLGSNISEGDRKFVELAYFTLKNTREGNKLLHKILSDQIKHSQGGARTARDYLDNTPGHRRTAWGMDKAVSEWSEKQSLYQGIDGQLTGKGKELMAKISGGEAPLYEEPKAGAPQPAPGSVQPAPPPAAEPKPPSAYVPGKGWKVIGPKGEQIIVDENGRPIEGGI